MPFVIVDEPQGSHSSLPLLWEATSDEMAVVRFHGRNEEMWNKKGLATSALRFNYLYSEAQLKQFVEPVKRLKTEARQVHAMFNNCYEDKAQRNARQLMGLLGQT